MSAKSTKLTSITRRQFTDWYVVLEKCIARHPNDRYRSAQHFAEDLQAIAQNRAIATQGQPYSVRMLRYWQANPSLLMKSALLCMAIWSLVMVAGWLWRTYEESQRVLVDFGSSDSGSFFVVAENSKGREIASFEVPSWRFCGSE